MFSQRFFCLFTNESRWFFSVCLSSHVDITLIVFLMDNKIQCFLVCFFFLSWFFLGSTKYFVNGIVLNYKWMDWNHFNRTPCLSVPFRCCFLVCCPCHYDKMSRNIYRSLITDMIVFIWEGDKYMTSFWWMKRLLFHSSIVFTHFFTSIMSFFIYFRLF